MGKKKKSILLLSGLLLLLVVGAVGVFLGLRQKEPVVEEVTSKLYWNADREQYIPKLGGNTIRKPEADGLWTVRFLVEGELVEHRVKDKEVMVEVDSLSALGLTFDEEGIINGVIDIRDMGIREVAKSFYVQTMNEKVVTANSSFTGAAVDVSLNLSSETHIWNVTGLVEPMGVEDDLQIMDCIRAFNNDEGKITDIFIVEREELMNGVSPERYCEHCDQVVTWRMWLAGSSLPYASGHFRLMKDVELKSQYSMAQDRDIVLDLNGKTVTTKEPSRVISLHKENVTLSVVDGSEEQTGRIKGHGEYSASGAVIWVRYGTFNLYRGTIDASEVISRSNGVAVYVNKETTFNMYNGTILGGLAKAKVTKNEETGKESLTGGWGGSIYCIGTMNMYDGEVLNGEVASFKNSAGKARTIAGGNIALDKEGVLNLYGGKIAGGKITEAHGHGGNISVRSSKAVLNMSGGTIMSGVSMGQGGNIASWGIINMTGGSIVGGKNVTGDTLKTAKLNETSTTHNIFLVSATLNMSGGTIEGFVGGTKGSKDKAGEYIDWHVKLSGAAKIWGAKTNLTVGSGIIDFGKLSSSAKIGVNGSGFISTETIEANKNYVYSDLEGADVLYHEKRLFIGKQSCVCGGNENGGHFGACDGRILAWQPWTKDTTAPTKEGNWYLLSDVQLKSIAEPSSNTTLCVDLNGKKITGGEGRRVYSTVKGNVNLTITDLSSKGDGRIVAQTGTLPEKMGKGGCVWVYKTSNVTFYGGILDATKVILPSNGAAVAVEKNCTFMMYGGTIEAGKTVKEATPDKNGKYKAGYGGAAYIVGKFDMYGGLIQGGSAEQHGGNIYAADGGTFNLIGGEMLNGKAESCGGNISGTGKINITGGTVANGEAPYGGNVCARKNMTMSGGVIRDGIANGGGNIYISDSSKVTVSGGTISGGQATSGEGGNIRLWTNSELSLANCEIKDGVAKKDGGNIYVNDKSVFTMTNVIVTGGSTQANGGNLFLGKGSAEPYSTVSITGGEIRGGYAKKTGGNVYVKKADVTLAGSVVILDGTTKGQGGIEVTSNLYLETGVTVTLNGLTSGADSIGVSSVDSTFATNANADQSDLTRFFSDGEHPIAQGSKNDLFIGKLSCMCGGYQSAVDVKASADGKHAAWCTEDMHAIEWHEWRSSTSLPKGADVGMYYYLTSDIALDSAQRLQTEGIWGLDLNGKTITNSERACNIGKNDVATQYYITDTSAGRGGSFAYNEATVSAGEAVGGMLFFVQGSAEVHMYAGTIDATGITGTNAPALVVSKGTFVLHGGAILPGSSQKVPAAANSATNSVEVRQGTFDVRGGIVEGEVRLTREGATLKLSGSPKVGVASSTDVNKDYGIFVLRGTSTEATGQVQCTDVQSDAVFVLKNTSDMVLGGTGEASAFMIKDALEGKYNQLVDDNTNGIGQLSMGAKLRSCGDVNCTGNSTTHSCELPGSAWQPWNATLSAEKNEGKVLLPRTAGAYYLTEDIEVTGRANANSNDAKISLDLNGHTVTKKTNEGGGSANRILNIGATGLTYAITDSSSEQKGTICFEKDFTSATNGELFFFETVGTINIYGGRFDMSNIAKAKGNPIQAANGNLNIYGGTFIPAAGKNGASSNCIAITGGSISVYGGTIYGEVYKTKAEGSITLSGSPKVGIPYENNADYGIRAKDTDIIVNCNNVAADAQIVLENSAFIKLSGTGEASAFTIVDIHNQVVDDNAEGIGNLGFAARLRSCGDVNCTGNSTTHSCELPSTAWQPWNTAISKSYDNDTEKDGVQSVVTLPDATAGNGAYYLIEDMTLDYEASLGGNKIICLDLNGYTVQRARNGENTKVIVLAAATSKMSIADSVGGGTICFADNYGAGVSGEMIHLQKAGAVFNLYSGTLDCSQITSGDKPIALSGTMNMYGGTIKPATSVNSGKRNCIVVGANQTLTVKGGAIYGDIEVKGTLVIIGSPIVGDKEKSTDTYSNGIVKNGGLVDDTGASGATIVYK